MIMRSEDVEEDKQIPGLSLPGKCQLFDMTFIGLETFIWTKRNQL